MPEAPGPDVSPHRPRESAAPRRPLNLRQIGGRGLWSAGLHGRRRVPCGHPAPPLRTNRRGYWIGAGWAACLAIRLAVIPRPGQTSGPGAHLPRRAGPPAPAPRLDARGARALPSTACQVPARAFERAGETGSPVSETVSPRRRDSGAAPATVSESVRPSEPLCLTAWEGGSPGKPREPGDRPDTVHRRLRRAALRWRHRGRPGRSFAGPSCAFTSSPSAAGVVSTCAARTASRHGRPSP